MTFEEVASGLVELARRADGHGWVLGTSGNFSAVVSETPLRVAITPSGLDKGRLSAGEILEIDDEGRTLRGHGRPSAETPLHLAIVRTRGARAVAHTHSTWSTLLSDRHAKAGGIALQGYEMLKGLAGVETHEHREWLPIVENSQDWNRDAPMVAEVLRGQPAAHGLLIRRHGLYTWGRDLGEAGRHLEALEFLLEVSGRAGS
jgi:methylthioribulose-1-phosphate dehydratase